MKPGPKPRPGNVHWLNGNPSKLAPGRLMDSLQPEIEIPDCPAFLLPEAKKEWKRLAPQLERYGLVSKLDRGALALVCQTWARWVWAEKQLARAQRLAEQRMAEAADKGEEYTGGDGLTMTTTAGNLVYSPHWVIANKAMEQYNRYCQDFGLTPSSRTRVTPSNHLQRDMFGDDGPEGGEGEGFSAL